jgi:HupE / UreJ protein
VAFAFGLLHGFGFASGLAAMGLPKDEIPIALLLFNVGVELGQLAFVLALLVLARSARRVGLHGPLALQRLPGYLVGTLGAFWTIQRTLVLLGVAGVLR